MRVLPANMAAVTGTAARIGFILCVLAAPILAMPLKGAEDGILVGGVMERTSGAGLVIVVGLQRAR